MDADPWLRSKRKTDMNTKESLDRAFAMVNDPNTEIDLTGLDPKDIAWVMASRAQDRPVQIM